MNSAKKVTKNELKPAVDYKRVAVDGKVYNFCMIRIPDPKNEKYTIMQVGVSSRMKIDADGNRRDQEGNILTDGNGTPLKYKPGLGKTIALGKAMKNPVLIAKVAYRIDESNSFCDKYIQKFIGEFLENPENYIVGIRFAKEGPKVRALKEEFANESELESANNQSH